MGRKKKIISKKIEDNDYNLFFQEMVLAERNYHKNEEAFNEHVNNILNMKNPDYIYRIFLNFKDYDYDKLLFALCNCEYSKNNKDSFSYHVYCLAVQRKIPAEKFVIPLYNYYMHSSNLINEFPDRKCSSTDKHFFPLFYYCCEFINELDDKDFALLTDIFVKIQEYESKDNVRSSNYYILVNNIANFDIGKITSSVFLQCSVEHFLHFAKNVSNRIDISDYKEKILSLNNAEALYQLASHVDISYIPKITTRLVKLNNYEVIIKFCRDIAGVQIKMFFKNIISSKNPKYIYQFAKEVDGAPINRFADAIILTKNCSFIYMFAKDIPSAPVERLGNAVAECGDADIIYQFAKNIPNAPITKLADAIILTNSYYLIYKFARDIPDASIEKLAIAIANSGDANIIYQFAEDIPNAPVEKLGNAIAECGDADIIYKFARNIPNAPITKLANAIILTKNYYLVYKYARDIPSAPVEKLGNAIANSGDADIIYQFAEDIPNAPIDNLGEGILLTSDLDLIIRFFKLKCVDENKLADVLLKYGKKLDKKNVTLDYMEDEKYGLSVKQFLKYHQDLAFDKIIPLLFQLSSNDVLNYICTNFPYRNINVEDMFSNIIKSDYSIYFKFYLLKDLDFKRYRFFLNFLKDEKNISFLETFTSVDTIIQNSVDNSKSDLFYEMQILQDEVLSFINTSDILDVSKCTLQMILQKINKFYIDYMSYYSDECFKVIRKKIGN